MDDPPPSAPSPAYTRLIFPRGVELEATPRGWRFATSGLFASEVEQLGVPVLIKEQSTPDHWILVNSRTMRMLQIEQSDLITSKHADGRNLYHVRNLAYNLGAVTYHCSQLALKYAELCRDITKIYSNVPEWRDTTHRTYQAAGEAYFEFDACVTAGPRIYDALRTPIWAFFHSRPSNCPGDLERVLELADGLPSDLHEAIAASWNGWGKVVREYRDSIEHYAPIEFGLSSASMSKLSNGTWSACVRIPDNPSANSRRKFTYVRNLDALDYCRELTSKLSVLVTRVVDLIAPPLPTA